METKSSKTMQESSQKNNTIILTYKTLEQSLSLWIGSMSASGVVIMMHSWCVTLNVEYVYVVTVVTVSLTDACEICSKICIYLEIK